MAKNRIETTLFMLASVDGKISTGDSDELDPDKDFPRIKGIKEGFYQYYDLELQTDRHSLSTGRTMAKIGVNTRKKPSNNKDVSLIIIDRKPHLTKNGINYLVKSFKTLYLVTNNNNHPAFEMKIEKNLKMIYYPNTLDLKDLLTKLKRDYKIERVTIQSGGTLNSSFLKQKLVDHVSIVIAPAFVGGKNTSTVVDGESLHSEKDLIYIKALKLRKFEVLKNSYIHLYYDVINETEIEPKK